MKTTKQFSIMMAVVLLSFSINSCKEGKEGKVAEVPQEQTDTEKEQTDTENLTKTTSITITLHVDTNSITNQNVDSTTCYFTYSVIPVDSTYNFKQKKELSLKNYTTLVKLEDEITWVGVSSSSPDTDLVKIKKIKYDTDKQILNKDELDGETYVFGKVTNGKKSDEEKYLIKFAVFNNGKHRGNYTIDPKLRIL